MYDNSVDEKDKLAKQMGQTTARLKRAGKLTTALADEQVNTTSIHCFTSPLIDIQCNILIFNWRFRKVSVQWISATEYQASGRGFGIRSHRIQFFMMFAKLDYYGVFQNWFFLLFNSFFINFCPLVLQGFIKYMKFLLSIWKKTCLGWTKGAHALRALMLIFSRRFRRKSRLLQWLVFFRQFNAIGPLFVH